MSYEIGQYNYDGSTVFQTPITALTAVRADNSEGTGYIEGIELTSTNLEADVSYHAVFKILKLDSSIDYTFTLYDEWYSTEDSFGDGQTLTTITVEDNSEATDLWETVEVFFTPFQESQYLAIKPAISSSTVYPFIVLNDLCQVLNGLENSLMSSSLDGLSLLKIGVQTHPGVLQVINGELIQIGKTGMYELKNSLITITSYAVIVVGTDDDEDEDLEDLYENYEADAGTATKDGIVSRASISKTYNVPYFTMDYMYSS